ncbi:MAG: methionine ABC transporter ATP-binding protein [Raoultibacter sp.]|jgi:D-methionine transport system ATP-binding protein
MIQIEHLYKTYDSSEQTEHHALSDVNLTIEDGEVFGVIGASGAGKSTLVRCINLLERPSGGNILIDGVEVTGFSGKELLQLRNGIGMIFQSFSLFQQRTVLQNVTFPLELRHDKKANRQQRARELLELVGLSDKEASYPSQLSGGQQQRVAIARALANNPKIMLCDEATSALDTKTTFSILELLRDINEKLGVTMVVITHSLSVVRMICDRTAVLDKGRVVEVGNTLDIFSNPESIILQELIRNDSLPVQQRDGGRGELIS